ADAGTAQQTDRLAAANDVEDDLDRAVHGTAEAARPTDDAAGAIADRADAMQRLLDACAIVAAERREPRGDVGDVFRGDRCVAEKHEVVFEARFGRTAEIEHDFDHTFEVRKTDERLADREGKDVEELRELPVRREGRGVNRDGNGASRSPARKPGAFCIVRYRRTPNSLHAGRLKPARRRADTRSGKRRGDAPRRDALGRAPY